jgi:hypothetical protein
MQELVIPAPETLPIRRPSRTRDWRIPIPRMTVETRRTACSHVIPRGVKTIVLTLRLDRPVIKRRRRWWRRTISRMRASSQRKCTKQHNKTKSFLHNVLTRKPLIEPGCVPPMKTPRHHRSCARSSSARIPSLSVQSVPIRVKFLTFPRSPSHNPLIPKQIPIRPADCPLKSFALTNLAQPQLYQEFTDTFSRK